MSRLLARLLRMTPLLLVAGCPRSGTKSPVPPASSAALKFVDEAQSAGVNYRWEIAGKRPLMILQTIGNGCALFDYDRDGNLDLLLVGPKMALYQGDGRGKFSDVSAATGMTKLSGRFLGVAVGDYDNDGFDDLYLSGYREGRLLHNGGGKAFQDVTPGSGLKPQPWGTSAAWAETRPGSGKLDLAICNYADFGPQHRQLCNLRDLMGKSIPSSCGPREYTPLHAALYRNDTPTGAAPRFVDISKASGMHQTTGRGLGVAAVDLDGEGYPTLTFANDEIAGDLMRPQKGPEPRYANEGETAGTAYDRDGNVHGGMGTDWGDYNNDGRFDLLVATFHNETKALYHNDGGGVFSEVSYPAGIGTLTLPFVAFGCRFLDCDNDGWLDIALANGHVQDNIAKIEAGVVYKQGSQLFRNRGGAGNKVTFEEVTKACGPDLGRAIVGRGLATGDWDNDGRVDLVIVDSEGAPLLLRNRSAGTGLWIGLSLRGTKSNRNGYGAIVTVRAGGKTLVRHCHADGSYFSSSDPRVHLGLGAATTLDEIAVRWPSGRTERFSGLAPGKYHLVEEGKGQG